MKRFSTWATLGLISTSLLLPFSVSAEESQVVEPQELNLEIAKKADGAYSVVQYEDGRPIVARSIASSDSFIPDKSSPTYPGLAELSDEAKDAVVSSWLIDPKVGGAVDEKNTVLLTTESVEAMDEVYAHLLGYMLQHPDLHLDIQSVPVYYGLDDVVPTYVFVGFRALDTDGRPIDITLWDIDNELLGYFFEGGDGYHYLAVSNESSEYALNYSTGEQSKKPKHDGFEQPFEPAHYFGTSGEVVNDETVAQIDEDNLPPGSSPVFLENGAGGINGLEVGTNQASGKGTGGTNSNLMAALMPIALMGAVLLIAMGS